MKFAYLALAAPALLATATFSAPAAAQYGQDVAPSSDIVVTGRYHDADPLSAPVSYADLDLGTAWGRDALRHRVKLTARYLCDQLGESDTSDPIAPSCREAATSHAMARVADVEDRWAAYREAAWTPGPAWHAPYSDEWAAGHSNDGGYSGY